MIRTTYFMRQISNPVAFLNEYAPVPIFRKHKLLKEIRKHQHYNTDEPYVANLGAGRLLIAETPIEVDCLATWLAGKKY